MRREELLNATRKILADIEDCGIQHYIDQYIGQMRQQKENKEFKFPVECFQKYLLLTQDYDETHRTICSILNIDMLLDINFWHIIGNPANNERTEATYKLTQNIHLAVLFLPKILTLIKQDYISAIKENSPDIPDVIKDKVLLNVIVIEEKDQFSSPLRLSHLFESISEMYSVFAKIENESESDLIVLTCDSGSDKSFDFLGAAKIIEQVKETILEIWERKVFYRQKHMSNNIELIANALPVVERIEELKKSKTIEPEMAELLKREIISGATKFIKTGAIIPELEAVSSHSPRQLMKPEPKLLISPWSDKEEKTEKTKKAISKKKDEYSGLSEAEETQLKDLLKKAKKSKRKTKGKN